MLLGGGGSVRAATDLLGALAAAEDMDPFYREAQTNALAVAEGVPQARADVWLPRLSFSAAATRQRQDITLEGGFGAGGVFTFPTYRYQISLEQPVYHHDRIIALKQADARVRQAQVEVIVAQQEMMLRVAERYFDVLAAQDNLDFAIAEKESLKSQLEQAEQRFEVGLIAITDVQEAQAGFDRAQASEIEARNQVENAHEALREVTGAYHDDLAELGDTMPLLVPEPQNLDAWTQTALSNNLQLSAALIETDVAKKEIRRQFAQHLPTVDIVGGHGFNEQGGRFGSSQVETTDIGVELNVPIFSGGRTIAQTREAEHLHAAALERLEQARRAVQRDTRQSYLGVASQISAVRALQQAVISSRTALESTRAGFEVGTRTAIDVIGAERGLSQAQRDLARARYDYIIETLRLKKAAGSLQPDDLAAANGWLSAAATPEPTDAP